VDDHCQIFGHEAFFNSFNDTPFKQFSEVLQEFIVIDFCSVKKTTSPGKNTGNGVGRSLFSLLPLSVMSGDCSVSSFRLNNAIRSNKN